MFNKKWIYASAAAVMTTAGVATADTYFGLTGVMDEDSSLMIETVTADSAGVLEVYDYHTGELGDLLGSEELNAGANSDVLIDLGAQPRGDVMALVKIDGEIAAMAEIDLEDEDM
ncbi:MAG: hypothetical protein GVY31_06460 [Alphaproteobacteria bacterium]|jgi:hypothetical protein|nr:hypothetical protein [Alphaproteobacteria bacterium]